MSAADSSTRVFEKQLFQYLLSTKPVCLTIVGQQSDAGPWVPADTDETLRVLQFESLADCHAATEVAGGQPTGGACVALLHLDGNEDYWGNGALALALGKAVRRFPERLVVSIDTPEPADSAFFAFGFRKLQLAQPGSIRLFEYCLSEYKQPPDWLNARYWANPDRFEQDADSDIYSEDDSDDEE